MSDPYVFHFVAYRGDAPKGERLATFAMEPDQVPVVGGMRVVNDFIETERREWQRRLHRHPGYGREWAVRIVKERGYVRSVFPGAALRPAPPPQGVLAVSGQRGRN